MRRAFVYSVVIALAWLAPTATADLLVTRDGESIETRGPWKVKGRQVIFTDIRGVLSSLRFDDVDLEASEEATRKAKEPPPPKPETPAREPQQAAEAPREAVLTLTNKDIGRAPTTTEQARALGEEFGENMGEGMGELGQAMAEGMAKGMEIMAETLGVMAQLTPRLQTLDQQFDLDTPEGIRAAAPGLAGIADFLRSKRSGLSPEATQFVDELADEFDEVAVLARENPEAALERRSQMELNKKQ